MKRVTPKPGMVFVTRSKETRTPSRRIVAVVGDESRPKKICYSVGNEKPRWCQLRAFRRWLRGYEAIATRTRRPRSLVLR